MAKRDYYEVLGVDRNADAKAVKKAYRNLAMKYHPDRNPGDASAAETMKDVNEAYAVLNDPKKRELYNSYGHAGLDGFSQEDIFRGVDFSSLFSEFGLGDLFGFGGDSFGGMFGGRTRTRQRTRKGADIRYDLELTLDDVASGFKNDHYPGPGLDLCRVPGLGGGGRRRGRVRIVPGVGTHRPGRTLGVRGRAPDIDLWDVPGQRKGDHRAVCNLRRPGQDGRDGGPGGGCACGRGGWTCAPGDG